MRRVFKSCNESPISKEEIKIQYDKLQSSKQTPLIVDKSSPKVNNEEKSSNKNEIITRKEEVDFKTFFQNIVNKHKSQNQTEEDEKYRNSQTLKENIHSDLKKNDLEVTRKKSFLKNEEELNKESKYKYNVFAFNRKPLEDFSDSRKMHQYLDDLDQLLANYKRSPSQQRQTPDRLPPQTPKKDDSYSNENDTHLTRLSRKYLRTPSKSPQKDPDLSLGEFLCINCDEFIDAEDMNTHSQICEPMPKNKDLIIINYKLEKIKTAFLMNMKREGSLDEKLEEYLNIMLNCVQRVINSNENLDALDEIIQDLNEIYQDLPTRLTSRNRVYITLLDRTKELANLKRNVADENLMNTRIKKYDEKNNKQIGNLRNLYPEKKIFAPPSSHIAHFEQKENYMSGKFNDDISGDEKNIRAEKIQKQRIIFKELGNFRKNEELILAKPKEISLSPPTFNEKKENIKTNSPKESENLKKIKQFLMEKEKQRIKFNEKISKFSIPDLEQFGNKNGSVMFKGDANRRKRFLELVDKLKHKDRQEKKNVSNTELYEECQNNQIHENNWEGFVRRKFQNIY